MNAALETQDWNLARVYIVPNTGNPKHGGCENVSLVSKICVHIDNKAKEVENCNNKKLRILGQNRLSEINKIVQKHYHTQESRK